MPDAQRYRSACEWFHLIVDLDEVEQKKKLSELRDEDKGLAQLISEMLSADLAARNESFLEHHAAPTRTKPENEFALDQRLQLPRTIGNFKLEAEIGRGGMGIVYLAHDELANRSVALKVIRSGSFSSPEQIERFRREAKAASQLEHPNIVRVYFVGNDDGTDYFAMEYVAGNDLYALIRNSPMDSHRAARLISKIALALDFAHARDIIHRDVKPKNILVDADGNPRLLDFGLAKTLDIDGANTQTDQVLGTVHYMAPEQVTDAKNAGPKTDVYGLGATLYHCLTGKPPVSGDNFADMMQQLREQLPVAPRVICPDVDPDLELICLRCIQKNPADRYESAKHVAADLNRFLLGEPVEKAELSWWHSFSRQLRRDELSFEMPSAFAAAWIAGLTFAFHLGVFSIIVLQLSNLFLWILLIAWFAATNIVNYAFHWSQFWQLSPLERQSGIIQLSVHISLMCLILVHGPLTLAESSRQFLDVYPPLTMIVAVAFVAHGNAFGRMLLPAFLFFPLAILMAYVPLSGPLLLGLLGGSFVTWCAMTLRRKVGR